MVSWFHIAWSPLANAACRHWGHWQQIPRYPLLGHYALLTGLVPCVARSFIFLHRFVVAVPGHPSRLTAVA